MSEVEWWVLAGLLSTVSAVSVAVGLARNERNPPVT
jgi:hypothetical protein